MREKLKQINGSRIRFIAEFERFGTKKSYKGPPLTTLLFINIRDKRNNKYCDHLWFTMCKGFKKLDLKPGDLISFDARVTTYTKGYRGRRDDWDDEYDVKPVSKDYKLSHPNKIVKHKLSGSQGLLF